MHKTKIEWVRNPGDAGQGYSWNPITGCHHGCGYCWARKMALRLGGRFGYPEDEPFAPSFHPDRLSEPIYLKKPSTILVSCMGDMWGDWVPGDWIESVLDAAAQAPQHTYLFLTKNPKRYAEFVNEFTCNHWIGVSITHPEELEKIIYMGRSSLGKRFVSFEPLLGNIRIYDKTYISYFVERIDWVIVGGQTNPGRQPEKEWVDDIVRFCTEYGIPLFMKDNLDYTPRLREMPLWI